jgi:hypothetical protein
MSERLVELSREHYEPLAETAGILGWLLEEYLWYRFVHLMLIYREDSDMHDRLKSIADDAANDSFFYLCRFLHLGSAFQLRGSSTYLLGDRETNQSVRQLHNAFLANLPQGTASDAINIYRIVSELKKHDISTMSLEDFSGEVQKNLQTEFDAFRNWLLEASPEVTKVTGALLEYSGVISRELAISHENWRQETGRPGLGQTRESRISVWTAGPRAAGLEAAGMESALPRPLGRVTPAGPSKPPPKAAADSVSAGQERGYTPLGGFQSGGGYGEQSIDQIPAGPPPIPRGLVNHLADAYPDPDEALQLAVCANIPRGVVSRSLLPRVRWQSIVEQAWHRNLLEPLLNELLKDENHSVFHDVWRVYLSKISK